MQGLLRLYLAACVVNAHIFHHLGIAGSYFDVFIPSSHAVFCFFIISGFFSFYQIDRYFFASGRVDTLAYYKDRLLRIYPTYLLCVAIGAPLYVIFAPWAVDPLTLDLSGWLALLAYNLLPPTFDAGLILSTATTWKYSILPPAWSLGNEIMFYGITPFVFAFARKRPWVLLVTIVGLVAYGLNLSPAETRYYDPIANGAFFLYGAACYLVFAQLRAIVASTHLTTILATAAMFGTLYLVRHRVGDHFSAEACAFYLAFGTLLIAAFLFGGSSKIDMAIGHISYPLFLIHVPIINVVASCSFSATAGYWTSMLGSVVVATAVFLLFDGQMNRMRRRQHEIAVPSVAGRRIAFRSDTPGLSTAKNLRTSVTTDTHAVVIKIEKATLLEFAASSPAARRLLAQIAGSRAREGNDNQLVDLTAAQLEAVLDALSR